MSEFLLPYAVKTAQQARSAAARIRRRVQRITTVPTVGTTVRPRPMLVPVHLSVLGGRTLNVAIPLRGSDEDVAGARLELVRGAERMSTPLVRERHGADGTLLTATVTLRHGDGPQGRSAAPDHGRPSSMVLRGGLWRFSAALVHDDGRETRVDLAAVERRVSEGPTVSHPPCPYSGAVFRLMRSVNGRALLKVSGPAQHAELVDFDLRWDRVTVRGRLLGRRQPAQRFSAEVRRRGTGRTIAAETVWDGDRFTFDLPLAAITRGQRTERTWDAYLTAGRTRLKVARRLTDVRHPKRVFRTPYRIVALEGGSLVRVHAYVTPAGALAVACADFTADAPADVTADATTADSTADEDA
ncbi:hypothetical protein AB0M29_18700 [Streptomyces sp. NPDC051976]|uniref:hypothetical protein n=1 Tax=Streptomyces sp. NPDC051976 TaxID=3154947 RepID=UPI00342EE6E2